MASQLVNFLMTLPIVLIALTVHEVAHGWMAFRLGDPTARNLGRLTLNPLRHLDPIGTLCMIIFHFGWARPVPINTRYFKKPRRDTALTALAGPLSNLVMAFAGVLLYRIVLLIFSHHQPDSSFAYYLQMALCTFLYQFFLLNTMLGVFNLIPIPPLDGSRIFLTFLPPKLYFGVMQYERYIQLGLLLLLWSGLLSRPLTEAVYAVIRAMEFVVGLIPFL